MGNYFVKKSESQNYNTNYIEKKFIKKYEDLSNVYKKMYQLTTGENDCTVSLWINLLLTQPISTYISPTLKSKYDEETYTQLKSDLKLIYDNFKLVFTSEELDKVPSATLEIDDYKKHIDAIKDAIWSRKPGNSKIENELPFTHRSILLLLKKEVETFRKDVSAYGKSYKASNLVYKMFINTDWRVKNYENFIDNEISAFIMKIDIKIREIESAQVHLNSALNLIIEEINERKERGPLISTSLAYIFREYRVRHNVN